MAKFPTTNLSMKYVSYALGFARARLSTLCAGAKTGGKNGYAFNIKEVGGSETDGELIEGAEPLWNMFSRESPGEWTVHGSTLDLALRLKREVATSKKYAFRLGDFAGYNPDAVRPYLFPEGKEIILFLNNPGSYVSITVTWNFGEVDWEKALNTSFSHIHLMMGQSLYASRKIADKYIPIEEYNKLGHYTFDVSRFMFDGMAGGDKLYVWGEFSHGQGSKIAAFPTTSYGVIRYITNWKKNKLGTVRVVYQDTPEFVVASNYKVLDARFTDDETQFLQFNIQKTGEDIREVNQSRSYIRCKWRDKTSWMDAPSYQINFPPEVELTRTCNATMPLRDDKEEYIDVELVLA